MITLIKGTAIHYLKVGGANTLYINAAHTHTLQELPLYYPDYMQDLGSAHAEGLKVLRGTDDVNWTYVTPTYNFDPDGKRTGGYRVAGEEFKPARSKNPNDGKQDYISYADFAKGVIDIIENKQYSRQRITLFSEQSPANATLLSVACAIGQKNGVAVWGDTFPHQFALIIHFISRQWPTNSCGRYGASSRPSSPLG